MQLSELIENNPALDSSSGASGRDIRGIASDSRRVGAGFLFAALAGEKAHGENFIDSALAQGARAILGDVGLGQRCSIPEGVAVIESPQPRRALAHMAARWWRPQPGTVTAVTGTDGKSSSVEYLRQLWTHAGRRAASIGTLGIRGARVEMGEMTTPDCLELHRLLRHLARQSVDHVAIEASSHGLDQHRVDGVVFRAAAFTRLGRDHRDYHRDAESYFRAKARLFREVLPPSSTVILSRDQPEVFERLKDLCRRRGHRIMSYGAGETSLAADEDIAYRRLADRGGRMRVRLAAGGGVHRLTLPFLADFQVMNALCALGMFVACGGEWRVGIGHLEGLTSPSGRLERVGGRSIYIDYAHTPDALSHVLTALRQGLGRGRLIVVLGCGGERDRGKRGEMGQVAARLADRVIVTDDNPRHEDPAGIRRMILAGIRRAEGDVEVEEIASRPRAIRAAVESMADDDRLLIAGKGHETMQIVGDARLPLDERAEVLKALGTSGGKSGGKSGGTSGESRK